MKNFVPVDMDILDSNIAENEGLEGTIYPYVLEEGYLKGVQRYYGARLYEARVNINPLANYLFNDVDALSKYTTNLHTQTKETDSTSVSVVSNATIVYVQSLSKYFRASVTANINFLTENWTAPTNFTDLGTDAAYRYEYLEPKANSIYWKDLRATNRNRCTDKALNTQSIKYGTEMWFEFESKNMDKVVLLNLEAQSAKIIVYKTDIENPIHTETVSKLIDRSSIVNWRTLSQFTPLYYKNVDFTLPFYTGTVKIRVILSSETERYLKLGEVLHGQSENFALTVDSVPITVKSSADITEKENGEIIFEDENSPLTTFKRFSFELIFDSKTLDATLKRCENMIGRRVVIYGENTDEPKYSSLIIYGLAVDVSPTFQESFTKSEIQLQVKGFAQ